MWSAALPHARSGSRAITRCGFAVGLTLVVRTTTSSIAMETTPRHQSAQALQDLGFTGLEAEVYAALLEGSPVTAYRVAQQVGKAAANVYKAVESLRRKGAILVDD